MLARRPIKVVTPIISLVAPDEANVGAAVVIEWTGPGNSGDYLTIVPQAEPDGKYANYEQVRTGASARVTAPLEPGDCEIRYVSGQGARVLARRPIRVVAVPITLKAPERVVAGAVVAIEWAGPDNSGDYITIVPKSAANGASANYAYTRAGVPARVSAPAVPAPCEIRYMSGQGNRVLGRADIEVQAVP